MRGAPRKREPRPRLACDRADHAERRTIRLQHGSLLDVHFGVRQHFAAFSTRGFDVANPGIAERDACGIDAVKVAGRQSSSKRAAAEIGRLKARPFFIGEADNFEVKRQRGASPSQLLDRGERNQHTEWAVVFSRVAYGIEVRAEEERFRFRVRRRPAPDQVKHCILAHLRAG